MTSLKQFNKANITINNSELPEFPEEILKSEICDNIASLLLNYRQTQSTRITLNRSNRSKSDNIKIINDILFNEELSDNCIDFLYQLLGRELLRYDDDDYVDNIISKVDSLVTDCSPYLYKLVLIANALLNYKFL